MDDVGCVEIVDALKHLFHYAFELGGGKLNSFFHKSPQIMFKVVKDQEGGAFVFIILGC
jgi:hypothetical protein